MRYYHKTIQTSFLSFLLLVLAGLSSGAVYAAQAAQSKPTTVARQPISIIRTQQPPKLTTPVVPTKVPKEDYFISADTVVIGCTAGMAAGVLVGSVPVAGAMMSGIGVPESVSLLVNLTGMGCGVGAVSSAVAIFTAWMLNAH